MNISDTSLFLLKLNIIKILQTKLAACINNIIELAVTYLKRILKTALTHVTMRLINVLAEAKPAKGSEVVPESRPVDLYAWVLPHLKISDPPKSTSLFRTLAECTSYHARCRHSILSHSFSHLMKCTP